MQANVYLNTVYTLYWTIGNWDVRSFITFDKYQGVILVGLQTTIVFIIGLSADCFLNELINCRSIKCQEIVKNTCHQIACFVHTTVQNIQGYLIYNCRRLRKAADPHKWEAEAGESLAFLLEKWLIWLIDY